MRIRKRTPTKAASPARTTDPPPPEERPEEKPETQMEALENQGLFGSKNSVMEVTKLEPDDPGEVAKVKHRKIVSGSAITCSRNDGKRWRCKNAAAPGSMFCDRHIAWWNRTQKVKHRGEEDKESSKKKPARRKEANKRDEAAKTRAAAMVNLDCYNSDDGFYYYGGFQPGCRKSAKRGGREDMDDQDASSGVA